MKWILLLSLVSGGEHRIEMPAHSNTEYDCRMLMRAMLQARNVASASCYRSVRL